MKKIFAYLFAFSCMSGNIYSQVTLDSIIDVRDSQTYTITKIGKQWWFAENLNAGSQVVTAVDATDNGIVEKHCFDDITVNCDNYGGLYQWNEIINYQDINDSLNPGQTQGICPVGWRVPSKTEWQELAEYISNVNGGYFHDIGNSLWENVGEHLKSTVGWQDYNGTDDYFFNGYPLGKRTSAGLYQLNGYNVYWWSCYSGGDYAKHAVHLYNGDGNFFYYSGYHPNNSHSVRCIRDSLMFDYLNLSSLTFETIDTLEIGIISVGESISKKVLVINQSTTQTIQIDSITSQGSLSFTHSQLLLAPGEIDTVTITFNPTTNEVINNILIYSNNPLKPVKEIVAKARSFKEIVDIRDNQQYRITKIGEQWWFADNLNYGSYIDIYSSSTDNGIVEKYCFDNEIDSCSKFGGLYKWDEMLNYSPQDNDNPGNTKGICPAGWRVPTNNEWEELALFISVDNGGYTKTSEDWNDVGNHLKATSGWSPNNGINNYDFFGKPGGALDYMSNSFGYGFSGYWWSSSNISGNDNYAKALKGANSDLESYNHFTDYGYSVRCIQDTNLFRYLNVFDVDMKILQSIDFGIVTGDSVEYSVIILNQHAFNTIRINDVIFPPEVYIKSSMKTIYAPGELDTITLMFKPTYFQRINEQAFFVTDDETGNAKITITGVGYLPLTADISANLPCSGVLDGIANAIPIDGISPYTYLWDGGNNTTDSTNTGLVHSQLYKLTITDSIGNTATDSIVLLDPAIYPFTVYGNVLDTICAFNTTNINITVTGTTGPYTYFWSNGEIGEDLSNIYAGDYSVSVYDTNNCEVTESFSIDSVMPYNEQELCMVSVDTFVNVNNIIWESPNRNDIEFFNVYEHSIGTYINIGSLLYTEITIYTDSLSDPQQRSYEYAITTVDTCGNESDHSLYHKTIHLSSSLGSEAGSIELIWNDYIDESGLFEPAFYHIYRGITVGNLNFLVSVPNSVLSIEKYTDFNVGDNRYYRIVIDNANVCDPAGLLKGSNGPFSRALSNLEDNRQQSNNTKDNLRSITVFPNPMKDKAIIQLPDNNIYTLSLFDITGKIKYQQNNVFGTVNFYKGNLCPGYYIIEVIGDNTYRSGLIIN